LNGKNHTLWGRVNFAYTFVSILTAFLKVRVFPVHPMRSEVRKTKVGLVRKADLGTNRSECLHSALYVDPYQ